MTMSDLEAEFEATLSDESTKEALNRALRALSKAKASKEELVEAVYQSARDAASALRYSPVKAPPKSKSRKTAEIAVSPLADWQLAKVTADYSTDVCEDRVERLVDKVIELTEVQRSHHPVKECHVYLLGDLIEGELIFPGQAHLIDASLFRQVCVDGPRILGNYLRRLAGTFEKVHVVGVVGNHGRLGGRSSRDMHPESNADAMMYEVTRLTLAAEPRITWDPNIRPGQSKWYATDQLGTKKAFLFHGNQVKGGALGFPWYGFGKKLLGWNDLYGPYDYAFSGHFHTPARNQYGSRIRHWGSGTTESQNEYAAEWLAAGGSPSQWLLFSHPEHGVTTEYECHL